MNTGLDQDQLVRYSRQLLLPQVQVPGQRRLLASHALIVGAGGLGSPSAMYLVAAGVGELTLADDDRVELSNLHRQLLHRTADVGRDKVDSARDTLAAINPGVRVNTIGERLQGDALRRAVEAADIVLDGSDNFSTRFAVNEACVRGGTPLVSGAAVRLEGQVSVFRPDLGVGPCYRCLYKDAGGAGETCAANGVLSPVVGVIGCLQAIEAIKVLAGFGETLAGRLLLFDAAGMQWREMRLRADPECPVCSGPADARADAHQAAG
ncbi:MAG TPA: molybdopterin-synthase adenylyltransferase MoeB [Gammaproteobacteria bacterium]|nr:molybdopterin-synthase adenylyltransferase MoeB [Gammaproteobacteria bacterium]